MQDRPRAYEAQQDKIIDPTTQATTAATQWLSISGALLALYFIWGSTYLGIRVGLEGFPPMFMGSIRFLIAGSCLLLFARAKGAPLPTKLQWRNAAIIGILLLIGGNGMVMIAEQQSVSSGLAALGAGASPIWVALFLGVLGKWPTRLEGLGLSLGFCGLLLLNLEGSVRANPLGAVALCAAPIFWALGSIFSTRLTLPKGMMNSAAQMLAGGIVFLPLGLVRGERIHALPSSHALLAVIYLIVFGSLIAFSAYTYLLQNVRTTIATSYAYVNPVVALVLGMLAGESITRADLVAIPIILCGVVLVMLSRHKP